MSPKNSSLAFDELKELESLFEESFEPKLELFVKGRNTEVNSFAYAMTDVIPIRGRITVSF